MQCLWHEPCLSSALTTNNMHNPFTYLSILILSLSACTVQSQEDYVPPSKDLSGLEVAYFASGCFWCVEAVYESVQGVEEAVSGYAGGHTENPTYREVGSGTTGHAETVAVYYDPSVVSYGTLVDVYYSSQDPTQVNGQGPDKGSAYRSIIFYRNDSEKATAESKKKALGDSGEYARPIATEILPFTAFYDAEDYHQDYEKRNPDHPYVRSVSIPRLNRFKASMPSILKSE